MAIGVSVETSGNDNSDGTSYTTASVTFTDGNLYTVTVNNSDTQSSGDSDVPTLTCTGLDGITQIATAEGLESGPGYRRTTIFHALGNGGSTTCTINFGDSQSGCAWCILEWTGTETGGTGGADAIIQSGTATGTDPLSVSLSAFAESGNATLYGSCISRNTSPSGDGSLVDQHSGNHTSQNMGFLTATLIGEDTSPSCSFGSGLGGAVACEISVPAAAGRTTKNTDTHPLGIRAGMSRRIGGHAA